MSRILVVDYSRTGNTHLVAKAIAHDCGADLERIREVRSRRGLWGYLRSAREAMKEHVKNGFPVAPRVKISSLGCPPISFDAAARERS